ncbi:aromatic ring-hydroxylating dioxygenase subunit alpha [Massilia sp. erpn]|uniref:aromatic ring-hydroxylating oxygenase subunit alpha n=1 Tax=Massilia sp. erpn TaxID=2738142 RepID=UPI0021072A42|nr:aromatic ring-hydroxylating dioxygenase subunit alpha [Massilia sp. erpn]UTY59506.1 aromatic ring-hydroxylating dioxygenase subunit alpha [Massilia sp. erpn]
MKHETQVQTLQTLLALREVGRDQAMLGKVIKLPVNIYTDPAILEQEMATVFRNYPMVAGHASHVRATGDYLLSDWDKRPFVVVRGKDGVLRAFLNTCRHRGARLVTGQEEQLKNFVCPFHGWVYGLDGTLRSMSRAHNFPGVDCNTMGLVELPVLEHGGLVWVHPTPGAKIDIAECLGPMAEDFECFKVDELVPYRKNKVLRKANWKMLIKTYLEGYHVPYLHKDTLVRSFKKGVIAHTEHGQHIRLSAARTNVLDALQADNKDWKILDYASVYYSLFPQAFFILHPDYVSINSFYPEAPDRTIWTHEMLYRPEAFAGEEGQAALAKRFDYTNDAVFDAEDFAVAEDVQLGLLNGANEYHTLGLEEGLLAIFQQNVERAMASAPPPAKQESCHPVFLRRGQTADILNG